MDGKYNQCSITNALIGIIPDTGAREIKNHINPKNITLLPLKDL